ncbi:MAG: hypothetical protein J6V88_05910 [Kiritimatiellae bacterium]|nr:hypothetical protein [Kiritimatiellia bacterium]
MMKQITIVFALIISVCCHAKKELPVVAGFTNDFAVIEFNSAGCLSKVMDRTTHRNLLRYVTPFSFLTTTDKKTIPASSLEYKDGVLSFGYKNRDEKSSMSVRCEPWGFVFTINNANVFEKEDIESFIPARFWPSTELLKWEGGCVCGFSDPTNSVILRSYNLETAMQVCGNVYLNTFINREFSPVGQKFAIVASPYSKARECLKAMTLDAGVFHTKCGGAWGLDSPENRRSYLFASVRYDTVDDWITLAERGGMGTLHFSGWWNTKGHYEPSKSKFPGGDAELKECVSKVRNAGLNAGAHTLTSGIDFTDSWIKPHCNTNLYALSTYTLSKPLEKNAKELYVNEKPISRHDTFTAYFSNGNFLRIGNELITYTGVKHEKPYCFTGIKRGANGTINQGLVECGSTVDYAFQHFYNFFPNPRSSFNEEMAECVGKRIADYGFSLVYHDGAEPFPRFDADTNRLVFASSVAKYSSRPVQFEASMSNPHGWWYHSTAGALDHTTWAAKRYHLNHVKSSVKSRNANFWPTQTGWWSPRSANELARGHFSDEMEYFASRNAGNDLPASIQGPNVNSGPLTFFHEDQMTLLGWYERARFARAFTPQAIELMKRNDVETRLRQNADGDWELTPVICSVRRLPSSAFMKWIQKSEVSAPAALRIEALFGTESYDSTNGIDLVGATNISEMIFATANKNIIQNVTPVENAKFENTFRLQVENKTKISRGAWSKLVINYPKKNRNIEVDSKTGAAFCFWVKGDGSGAILNLQLSTPAKFVGGISDHVVKLDFKGWRYVQLFQRERDVEAWLDYAWPYSGFYRIFRQKLSLDRINSVAFYLNEVPANGKTDIEISQVRVFPSREIVFNNPSIAINGEKQTLPFEMVSGDYAELENGVWTRFSQYGNPLNRGKGKKVFLKKGDNDFALNLSAKNKMEARAEISVFALGKSIPAFIEEKLDSKEMGYEAMRPQWYEPKNGFAEIEPVRARPGKKARLEIELFGRTENPTFIYPDGSRYRFDVELKDNERLVCWDLKNWKVIGDKRNIIKEGALEKALPILEKGCLKFEASENSALRVSIVKRYSGSRFAAKALAKSDGANESADSKQLASETIRAWSFDEAQGAFSREAGKRDWDVALSKTLRWVTGQFGTAIAFVDEDGVADVSLAPGLNSGKVWTATLRVRAAKGNKALSPWTLKGNVKQGDMPVEKWKLFVLEGEGVIPSFKIGSDGKNPFLGFVDDLRIFDRRLSAEEIDRIASDPMYTDIEGFQDDGTGGVKPIVILPPSKVEPLGKHPLQGEDGKKEAMSPSPFPDALSAYVWRNWGLVPVPILARVIDATEKDLEEIAKEMGLKPNPVVLSEWRRKGYITIMRRNWHLLPYEQLLPLLGMTREECFTALQEDDFLWIKMGRMKPKAKRIVWSKEYAQEGRKERLRLAEILRREGIDPNLEEEPRFEFIKELSQCTELPKFSEEVKGDSPFDFRLIFSYFADYGDPLADPEIKSYPEGLLQKLAAQGVNAVWLHTVLNSLTKDSRYPEFGKGSEQRIANLRKLVKRAEKYGIKVYLYMNEPRAQHGVFFDADPARQAIKGVADGRNSPCFAMCTSTPEVRRWLSDSLEKVFRQVPGLGGIFTITMSENLTNCASYEHKEGCPRCKNRTTAEILGEVNRTMIEGMRKGNPNAEALVWNWNWPAKEEKDIIALLPTNNCRLMAVSEKDMKFNRGGTNSKVIDYSISVVGPGEMARKFWKHGKNRNISCVAKVQAANSWELSPFPYIPTMDLVAEHAENLLKEGLDGVMLSWSLGCAPSPNLSIFRDIRPGPRAKEDVLDLLAKRMYGEKAPQARKAWTQFSEGFRNYPFAVMVIYLGPHQWGPVNPLYAEKTGYNATMVGIPYDDLKGWRSVYPAQTYIDLIGRVADGFAKGCELMKGVAPKRELDMYRAEQMHFASCRDQGLFVLARDAGKVDEMKVIAKRELDRAKEYWYIVRSDSRIGYESSNHYFFTPRDVVEKILSCWKVLEK